MSRRENMTLAADEDARLREAWLANGQASQRLLWCETGAKNGRLAQRAGKRCKACEDFLFHPRAAGRVPARPHENQAFDVTALQCGKAGGVEPVVIGFDREAGFRQIARAGFGQDAQGLHHLIEGCKPVSIAALTDEDHLRQACVFGGIGGKGRIVGGRGQKGAGQAQRDSSLRINHVFKS